MNRMLSNGNERIDDLCCIISHVAFYGLVPLPRAPIIRCRHISGNVLDRLGRLIELFNNSFQSRSVPARSRASWECCSRPQRSVITAYKGLSTAVSVSKFSLFPTCPPPSQKPRQRPLSHPAVLILKSDITTR
jgi:hypothetical protein